MNDDDDDDEKLPKWLTSSLETSSSEHAFDVSQLTKAYRKQRETLLLWLGAEMLDAGANFEPLLIPFIFSYIPTVEKMRDMWFGILRWHSMLNWSEHFITWFYLDKVGIICCGRIVYPSRVDEYDDDDFVQQFPNKTRSKHGTIHLRLLPR